MCPELLTYFPDCVISQLEHGRQDAMLLELFRQ